MKPPFIFSRLRNVLFLMVTGLLVSHAQSRAEEAVALLDPTRPNLGWAFIDGREFPGAKGGIHQDASVSRDGRPSLKITGDFTGGGIYVAADGRIPNIDVQEISFWVKNLETDRITLRVIEASGRCHQFSLQAKPSADWQQLVLPLQQYFAKQGLADAVQGVLKYEAWGGGAQSFKNDGAWKGPGKEISIVIANPQKEAVVRTIWVSDVMVIPKPAAQLVSTFSENFEQTGAQPEGWKAQGAVTVQQGGAFQGDRALVLRKTEATLRDKIMATGPTFSVGAGTLTVGFATRSDLTSQDNSYNGTLSLEFSDAAGKSLGPYELGAWFRQNPWKKSVVEVQVPDGATSAHLIASINKETPGVFALDMLSAGMTAGATADDGLRRMMFTMAQVGHLILPEDARTAAVEVWSTKELPDNLREVAFTVRDYWGAEQNQPIHLTLAPAGKVSGRDYLKYTATVDLASLPLGIGRYYELQGEIARPGGEAFSNYTSFAILPEAATNSYPPAEIPFTSRTWDQRIKEGPILTRRLGIRINNVWGRMEADPKKVEAPQIDFVKELGMGVLTGSPAHWVEMRQPGWEKLLANDGALIRQGVRNFFAKYGEIKPIIINLGNEPHSKGEDVKADVDAYRIVYQEIKKIDPSIYVVGSSIGITEDYFKAGFGEWCDAYDFHSYEDPEGVRVILSEKYPEMFKKYGFAKPVWSTEIGMNSQGMTRQAVAGLVYKKFANFFAGGGVNVSWFGLFYPDPDAQIHNSFASAHNVFDCRYSKYAPKLDAVAYYNAVNGIAVKKFVTDKVYASGARVFLFRDKDNRTLLIAYRDKGREDVFFPLPGTSSADMIRLDGSRDHLDTGGKGVSLTIGEDPLLLFYENGPQALPDTLAAAPVQLGALPARFYRDGDNVIEAVVNGILVDQVELKAPPFWNVRRTAAKTADGRAVARFSVQVAPDSQLREADLAVIVHGHGADKTPVGLLSFRVPVAGQLSLQVLPVPLESGIKAGLKLEVKNNSIKPQVLTWSVLLNDRQTLTAGKFETADDIDAKFAGPSSGSISLDGRSAGAVTIPLADVDPLAVYRVKAMLRDESGRTLSEERTMGGFVSVPRAGTPMKIDGLLDEAGWAKAPVERLDQAKQFYGFKFSGKQAPVWSGPADLSAQIRYLWDDAFLYVAVKVTDDIAGGTTYADDNLWKMDGLQFLIDPKRSSAEKPGKYEYSIGRGQKGMQAWCTLSTDSGAPSGDVQDFKMAIHRDREGSGNVTYEIAIPWSRVAPFKPVAGGNLGFTMIVNEDDGDGRDAFMTWFGNAHTKDIDTIGDLILQP
jgi:hypothetical protein